MSRVRCVVRKRERESDRRNTIVGGSRLVGWLVGPVKSLVTAAKVIRHVSGRSVCSIIDPITFKPPLDLTPHATLAHAPFARSFARSLTGRCIACMCTRANVHIVHLAGVVERLYHVCASLAGFSASRYLLASVLVLLGRGYGERGRLLLHTAPSCATDLLVEAERKREREPTTWSRTRKKRSNRRSHAARRRLLEATRVCARPGTMLLGAAGFSSFGVPAIPRVRFRDDKRRSC